MRRTPSALRWLAVLAWAAVIFVVSARPGSALPPGQYAAVAHFTEYAVLASLLVWALAFELPAGGGLIALAIVTASVYGISDEIHQYFVPGRTPDVADWGVDTLGALAGAALIVWMMRRRARARDQ